jgi:hypothetical protein
MTFCACVRQCPLDQCRARREVHSAVEPGVPGDELVSLRRLLLTLLPRLQFSHYSLFFRVRPSNFPMYLVRDQ